MKTATALFICLLILASTAIADVYPGPALYYSFDAGATVPDDSGNGNSGQVLGAVWVPDGVRGGAYSFHMTNSISAGNKFDVGTGSTMSTPPTGCQPTADTQAAPGGWLRNGETRTDSSRHP